MNIHYDREERTLTLLWSAAPEAEWRRARRYVDLLVDRENEPIGMRIRKTEWNVPELAIEPPSLNLIVNLQTGATSQAAPGPRYHQQQKGLLIPAAAIMQPQLPWDEPMPAPSSFNTRAKGICQECGAVAADRRRSTTKCGWLCTYLCPACCNYDHWKKEPDTVKEAAAIYEVLDGDIDLRPLLAALLAKETEEALTA